MDLELVFYLLTSPKFIVTGLVLYVASITIIYLETVMKADREDRYEQGFSRGMEIERIRSEVLS